MKERLVKYVIAAVAVLAASACTKTELREERRAISYAPVASKPTKAIIEGTTYPTSESFVVSAYHNGTAAYFENESAGYSSTLNLWETSETEYWPLGGSLTFIAYSPATASGLSIGATGVTATDYTIQTSEQMQTDICYASATVADCANHPASVPLVFSHALSQVVFRVKAAENYSTASNDVALALTSLGLSGINSVGDFANGTWSNQETPYPYTIKSNSDSPTVLTYDPVANTPETIVLGSYLFLPQTLPATARLNVGYRIAQTMGYLDNPPVSIPLGSTIAAWEPGKKYIYTLNIGMNDVITFTVSTMGWQDANDNIIVEEN